MARFIVVVCVILMSIFILFTEIARAEVDIVIDVSEQRMYVETPIDYYEWDVSTGRKGYSTPRGIYQPYLLKPMHYSSKYENAPMPNSIFFHGGYAIHATEAINNLGRPASHGCVRLHPQNARWLYQIVKEYGKENVFIIVQD
jgi:lipoprotein-anchoring transpeptidase ErfK/SrfK